MMAIGFGANAQADFMEDLISMTRDGIRRDAALEEMARNFGGKAAGIARGLRGTLSQGRPLADGMSGTFDPILVDAARAGEKGGRFEEAVEAGVELLRMRATATSQLIKAISYPAMILLAVLSLVLMLALYVLPEIAVLVPRHKWTPLGRVVIETGQFLKSYGFYVLLLFGGAIYAIVWSLPRLTGDIRATLDTVPPWRFYRAYQAATFMQNLSLLLRSGIMFRDALDLLARQASPYVAWHVRQMLRRLARPDVGRAGGSANAAALETGLLLEQDVRRMRLITQAAAFEDALNRMGKRTGKQVSDLLDTVRNVLSIAMLAFAGLTLGGTGLGLFQTLQQVGS